MSEFAIAGGSFAIILLTFFVIAVTFLDKGVLAFMWDMFLGLYFTTLVMIAYVVKNHPAN